MKETLSQKKTYQPFELAHFGDFYFMPYKAKPGSIGYDLVAPVDFVVPAHSRCCMPLNIAINLPHNIEGKIEPRSGFSIRGMEGYGRKRKPKKLLGFIPWHEIISGKQNFDADVLVGKIDPGYTDNINVIIRNNDEQFLIRRGTRIAQITFYRVISPEFTIVDKLSCSSRGGGLGSSGTTVGNTKKDISFAKYYATLTPEQRVKVDESRLGKTFNENAPKP